MGKKRINYKKTAYMGIEFDSQLECEYYIHLLSQPNISGVVRQPQYQLLAPFHIECNKCKGEGKNPSSRTGNLIKCRTCNGTGKRTRRGINYTADFLVIYEDGQEEVIDVKGFPNERFPVIKKLFEWVHQKELVVVTKKGKEWVRK